MGDDGWGVGEYPGDREQHARDWAEMDGRGRAYFAGDRGPAWEQFRDRYIEIAPTEGTIMPTDKKQAQLQAELALAQAQLAALQGEAEPEPSRWPSQPPVGTVLRFQRTFRRVTRGIASMPEETYTYVAIRTPREPKPWFVTGTLGREQKSWAELGAMIGDTALCEIAMTWFEVPALESAAPEPAQDVDAFVAMFFDRESAGPEAPEAD